MLRVLLAPLLGAACALAAPAIAGATSVVAAGPEGRALIVRSTTGGMEVVERTASGGLGPARVLAGPLVDPAAATIDASGSAMVLAVDRPRSGPHRLIVLRRAAGAEDFGAPRSIAQATSIQVVAAAANERGDVAAIVRTDGERSVLLTAVRGGAFGAPQELDSAAANAAIAVGGGGRVLAAWYDFARKAVHAQTGTIGSPLAAPSAVEAVGTFTEVAAAVDESGNATVAYVKPDRRRFGPAALVAARARPDTRFGSSSVLGLGGPPQLGAGFASLDAAAAGTTTAVAWHPNSPSPQNPGARLGVAIARGGGRFGQAAAPSVGRVRSRGRSGLDGQPSSPSVAVDRAGDVLLAYGYGHAIHATRRSARDARFGPAMVVSDLAANGGPLAALLSDRRPLVAWGGFSSVSGAVTRLGNRRPDLTPPSATVRLRSDAAAQLRRDNTVEVKVGCSEACLVQARAVLRTSTGRTILYEGAGNGLRRGATLTKRFVFDPARRSGRAGDGARVRITIIVENGSGLSRQTVRELELGD